MFSVSMIPYANMAPYRALGPPEGCRFVTHTPRESVTAISRGETWAACVPVGAFPELGLLIHPIGPYGIAAKGPVKSVLLFSDRPLQELDEGTRLYLTGHSVSSVRLLFLLLGQEVGFDHLPCVTDNPSEANAELVIGNKALTRIEQATPQDRLKNVTDLAEMWHAKTHLPFVFARWVIRNDAPPKFSSAMVSWLNRFSMEEDRLVQMAIPQAAAETGFDSALITRYFSCIYRVLDPQDLRGQTLFLNHLATHLRDPLFESKAEVRS